ncbi:MAG TPA: FAD-binding protein, partial [Myxococcales bacterium]|nr:FAD-binding protein [Myxococcales bacterium]
MDTDYTINQPVIGTLQDALNLAFGKNRIQVGGCLNAQSVAEVCSLLEAAHRFNVRVHMKSCSKDSLAIDLSGLNKLRDMDTISQLVTAESGMSVGELESALADEGLSLGPSAFADPGETLGRALARGDGAALVASVGAVLADGTLFHTPLAPRRATGPNPDALLVGTGRRVA